MFEVLAKGGGSSSLISSKSTLYTAENALPENTEMQLAIMFDNSTLAYWVAKAINATESITSVLTPWKGNSQIAYQSNNTVNVRWLKTSVGIMALVTGIGGITLAAAFPEVDIAAYIGAALVGVAIITLLTDWVFGYMKTLVSGKGGLLIIGGMLLAALYLYRSG